MAKTPQRTRVDWSAAKAFYVALGPAGRTFAAVSREFHVSTVSVRKHAHAEGWLQAAADADKLAADKALRKAFRSREANTAAVLRLRDLAVDASTKALKAGEAARLADVPPLVKIAELLVGEATERIDQAEVQEALGMLMQLAMKYIPRESQPAFVAEVRERLGAIGEADAA